MYDERPRRVRRKEIPATCPFCKSKIDKPKRLEPGLITAGVKAGRCSCGAVYIFDEAGKGGGEAVIDGLNLLCDGDDKRSLELQAKADYKMERRGYRPRTNSYDPEVKRMGAYSQPKLWFFCFTGDSNDE